MQFRLLGPMEVVVDERTVALGGTKQRATLGYLLLQANRVVATSRLLNALWGVEEAPTTARKILQNAVYGLRGVLASSRGVDGDDAPSLLTQAPGYVLRVDPEQVDLHLFHTWVGLGRRKQAEGDARAAAGLLREALALWRGPALADLVEAGLDWPELAAVQSTRLDVTEDYFDAQLLCGRHYEILPELETMVQAEPLRERSAAQLMLALYRCGRQAEALHAYSQVRAALVENLGLEPGRGLQQLQQAILTQDPSLSMDRPVQRGALAGPDARAARPGVRLRPALVPSSGRKPASVPSDGTGLNSSGLNSSGTDIPDSPFTAAASVSDAPAASGPQTGSDRRTVSVVSVRTRIAQEPGAEARDDLDELLDGAAEVVREQIERFGGTVTACLGSVSLAVFGLDETGTDDVRQATLAALAVRDVLNVATPRDAGQLRLTVHVCVTMGEVRMRRRGQDGVPTVVGATLDDSQFLLAEVPAGQVWASDAVRTATENAVSYLPTATSPASWQAFEVRERPAADARNSGRALELEVLQGLLKRTRHRLVPHLVTLLGEGGSGKSELLREFGRWLGSRPDAPLFLTGNSPATPTDHPLRAQAEILSAFCGIGPGTTPEAARDALADRARAVVGSPAAAQRMSSRLAPLLAVHDATHRAPAGADAMSDVLDAWRELFLTATRHTLLVLCVDDLHRADDRVLDAIEDLVGSAESGRLFLVAAATPELLLRRPTWAGGRRHTTSVTLVRPARATGEQLTTLLLSAARRQRPQHISGNPATTPPPAVRNDLAVTARWDDLEQDVRKRLRGIRKGVA
ncbi:AAA family ATPase [Streptomyces sp. ND05-3B]|nr:AAA family ATPase [Streptomyces caniscabiei]MBE4759159.1 AAA family ATPase [Streptomyces caniscabiei]MBE4773224.1 AAA family ATPase [Streptomyces caniscabiei]MBE4783611.1 AAA family ATPase [Streptomyces caniscabiei]MBE4792915.1 AAA family ATPase [Streptomyces caniscabiei]